MSSTSSQRRWYRRSVVSGTCTSFSNAQAFSAGSVPLPVQLVSFTGTKSGHQVQLSWTTENEDKISRYQIERSADAQRFTPVGNVAAMGKPFYHFTDETPLAVKGYYRLAVQDVSGELQYSEVITVQQDAAAFSISAFPEPVANSLQVVSTTTGQLVIHDLTGRPVRTEKLLTGTNVYDVSALTTGVYYLEAYGNGSRQVLKISKE